jgi:hypothetical protein
MNGFLYSLFSVLRVNHDFDILFYRPNRNLFFYIMKYHAKNRQRFNNLPSIVKNSIIHSTFCEMGAIDQDPIKQGILQNILNLVGTLRLKKLQNNITNAHEMGLPLINWILLNGFQGPIVFGINFVKINFYTFFAELSPLFSTMIQSKISDLEIWLNRPGRWKYVSTTKFFRSVEVVTITEKDKVDDEFR